MIWRKTIIMSYLSFPGGNLLCIQCAYKKQQLKNWINIMCHTTNQLVLRIIYVLNVGWDYFNNDHSYVSTCKLFLLN